jgi:hypothetical protein
MRSLYSNYASGNSLSKDGAKDQKKLNNEIK